MIADAVVLSPGQQYLHVLVPSLGEDGRIYFVDQQKKKKEKENKKTDGRRKKETKEDEKEEEEEETKEPDGEETKHEEWEIVKSKWDETNKINEVSRFFLSPFLYFSFSFLYTFLFPPTCC
jgi:hypothetical protein